MSFGPGRSPSCRGARGRAGCRSPATSRPSAVPGGPLDDQPVGVAGQPGDHEVARAHRGAAPYQQPVARAAARAASSRPRHALSWAAAPSRTGVRTRVRSVSRTKLISASRKDFLMLARLLRPKHVASAHCDLPCGVYDPAQARIEAESVKAIMEKYAGNEDPVFRARALTIKEERAELVKHHLWVLWTDYFKPPHLETVPAASPALLGRHQARRRRRRQGHRRRRQGRRRCSARSTRSPRSSGRPRPPKTGAKGSVRLRRPRRAFSVDGESESVQAPSQGR